MAKTLDLYGKFASYRLNHIDIDIFSRVSIISAYKNAIEEWLVFSIQYVYHNDEEFDCNSRPELSSKNSRIAILPGSTRYSVSSEQIIGFWRLRSKQMYFFGVKGGPSHDSTAFLVIT